MKIGVLGYGHFAGVVAHCLTLRQHAVSATDFEPPLLRLDQRRANEEPGWLENFACIPMGAWLSEADLLWIAYDVPLDATGAPVVDEILSRIKRLHDAVNPAIPFLVSCQWPVGTTRKIASECEGREFVYVMENVRVGKAIADFQAKPLPLIGVPTLDSMCGPMNAEIVDYFIHSLGGTNAVRWESAEFAKHSLNAFLALQIAFVNELARIAPPDVNMADVTRVLKSDPRVSPLAPLSAGQPFGGGSLKRDLLVLEKLYRRTGWTPILDAIIASNEVKA